MYAFPDMIYMGLEEGEEFPTDDHRIVAVNVLIGNPNVTQRDQLMDGVRMINHIPKEEIREVTFGDLRELGVPGV
jgi:hypothetical protein